MINFFRKNLLEIMFYSSIILLIVLPWFLNPGYLFFTDMAWGPQMKLNFDNNFLLLELVFKFFMIILPSSLVQKLFISLSFLTILLGSRKIVKQFVDSRYLIMALSLFGLFNPFIYDRVGYGQFSVVLGFGFLLFCFAYLWEFISKKRYNSLALSIVFSGLAFLLSPHYIFLSLPVYLAGLFGFFMNRQDYNYRKVISRLVIAVIIGIIINSNWLYPIFFTSSNTQDFISEGITRSDYEAFQVAGKTRFDAFVNIIMMSGFWGKDQFRYDDLASFQENWGKSFLILLPIIIYGLYLGLKNNDKKVKYLAIVLLIFYAVSLFLSLGIRMPFVRGVSYWMFDNVPFYKGMRETQKWVALIVVIYLIFLCLGIDKIFKSKLIRKNFLVSSLVLLGIIIMQAPLFVNGLNGQVKAMEYPSDWHELDKFIVENDNCEHRMLFLPWHMYMSFNWIGRIIANPANEFFTCSVIKGSNMEWEGIFDNSMVTYADDVSSWIFNKGQTDFLKKNEYNVRYIVIAKEIDWLSYAWIDNIDNIKLVKETRTLMLYEIKQNKYNKD